MGQETGDKKNLNNVKNFLAVLAGKGGVGKSTVAHGLAQAFHRKGFRVGVLDADIYGPSSSYLLPPDTFPKVKGEKVLPAISGGIKTLSAAHFPRGKRASVVRAPIATQIVSQFIEEVKWGDLDFLLVDFPPGTGDIQISLMQKIFFTGALVVTTPQELALLDVRKSMEMCLQMGVQMAGIVENMSYFSPPGSEEKYPLFGEGGGQKLADEFAVPLLAEIPIHPNPDIFDTLVGKLSLGKNECEIKQEDRYHFSIRWVDGKKSLYRFSDLQSHCPCVKCKEKAPLTHVEGEKIIPVGSYGVQVIFSKGCSKGIYPFSLLRKLG
ncbi:P-loop NTPase [Candidatus Neptunochlamydia vexilliferae]|uniref:Iron-sulfur cluster carrier protein n=1 Tax=Candidatus Neptunichlamydia vexilliferae TaxID=1651774 RepID=A0ABS0AXR5_9BACT|nr:P-loop NTPase [Candidatus Neptunochlamydia vexilliferae]MBF5058919.1 hypothetical protein [Candidatus Neptunochlamydia vexilliferae]